jgi:hypothetical protein
MARHVSIRIGMLPHARYSPNQFPVRTFKTVQRSQPEQSTGGNIPKTCNWPISVFLSSRLHVPEARARCDARLLSLLSKLRLGAAAEQVI